MASPKTGDPPETGRAFWQLTVHELLESLETTLTGLAADQAVERLVRFSSNVLRTKRLRTLLLQFLAKFRNPLVVILLFASSISALTGDAISFFIIAAIVLMSVTLDFIQEYRAGEAAERLRQSVAVRAKVLRGGNPIEVPLAELVPGDVALLAAGALVPGDGRVLEAKDFFVNEALITGEPYPVHKVSAELPDEQEILSANNTVLQGTSVVSGTAKVLVCRTGADTVVGGIADSLVVKAPATAFERGAQSFGLLIMRLTFFLVLFVLVINALFHRPWLESFLFAVALAVGLTPELLPMVVTVTLSRGALRMAGKSVIVKRLASIHDLGSMDVLCTDKTGTLTEARVHLERSVDGFGRESRRVLELAYLNSFFETGLKSPLDDAILEHTETHTTGWNKINEVPFDFERRRVSVLVDNGTTRLLVVKGAPEDILSISSRFEGDSPEDLHPMDKGALEKINSQFEFLGQNGFRVLGIAWRQVGPERFHAAIGDETELTFAGFAAFHDPPKESAKSSLANLAASGVSVKVITGDNELVTEHICRRLELPVTGILTGAQIRQMDDQALTAQVEKVNLFCRVTPAQKNRILLAMKRRNHVVGYLGDGINDAPSLHSADIGISVDSAVNVAKDAADMIMLKRDLGVLHEGVMEGRRTFGNISKYIMMGTSSNFGSMFSMAGASLILPFLPMLPLQILLNNLLYDLSEVPIPLDNVDQDYLYRPRQWDMNFIRNFMLIIGPVSSVFDFLTFYVMLSVFHAGEELFHTGWFIESVATQVLVIFIIRTRRNPFKSRPNIWLTTSSLAVVTAAAALPFTPLSGVLGFVQPPPLFFLILAGMVLCYLLAVEVIKRWFFRHLAPESR